MGIFNMPIFANGHIFFKWAYFTEYAQKKNLWYWLAGWLARLIHFAADLLLPWSSVANAVRLPKVNRR